MHKLNEQRLKEIIVNVLAEIANTTDMDKNTYISWLKNEVGITQDELLAFNQDGFTIPMPLDTVER